MKGKSTATSRCSAIALFVWFIVIIWIAVLHFYRPTSNIPHAAPATTIKPATTVNKPPVSVKASTPIVVSGTQPPQVTKPRPEDAPLHVVFSTDCSFFQDWQTIVVFHSAVAVGQKGSITRIASGCKEDKKLELTNLYKKLYPQYHVHFTPDFKLDEKTKKKYDFYNKPFGVEHWLDNAEPKIESGTVVALIDPDFIFLRPLTIDVHTGDNTIPLTVPSTPENAEFTRSAGVVRKGHPAAQLYGLGAPWATKSKNFNRTQVCGPNSPCLSVHYKYGEDHYSVGPPYILERDDLLRLTKSWTTFVPRVYERYPELLAEMYAYSMAAAHEDLPHLTMEHFMVSNTQANGEGWKWIDAFQDDVCEPPVGGIFYPGKPLPTFLHFCQFFRIGELGFQKRRVKPKHFQCDLPLFVDPPTTQGKLEYKNRDGEIIQLGRREARRNAFAICVIHRALNAAITDYKQRMCTAGEFINLNKTVNVVAESYRRKH